MGDSRVVYHVRGVISAWRAIRATSPKRAAEMFVNQLCSPALGTRTIIVKRGDHPISTWSVSTKPVAVRRG